MAAQKITVEITGESEDLQRACAAAVTSIKGVSAATGDADRSTRRYAATTGGARRSQEGLSNSLLRTKLLLAGLGAIPAAQGLSALAAGGVAATASLGPLAGVLAALPNLAATALQGVGTVSLATGGIADAVKAAGAAQESVATDSAAALGRASQAADQAGAAERALADAKRQSGYAEEDLTRAREDAERQLEDLQAQARGAAESEEGAVIALRRAQQEARRIANDPKSTGLDLREAEHRVSEARSDLADTRRQANRAREDWRDAQRLGVDGAPEVVAAQRQVEASVRAVDDAERQAAQASREMAQGAGEASSAASKLQTEMGKLSPEARAFAQTLIDLQPELEGLRAAAGRELFPGLQRGIAEAEGNLPVLEQLLERTGGALGRVGEDAGRLVGSQAFGRDLALIGERNARWLEMGGDATIDLADALRHLMVAAGPFTGWLVRSARNWAEQTRAQAQAGRQTGDTADFLDRTRAVMERLASISQSVADGLLAVGRAGTPLGDDLWRAIDRGAQRFEDWAESARGQRDLAKWFADARQVGRTLDEALEDAAARFRQLRRDGRSSFDALAVAGAEVFARLMSHAAREVFDHAPDVAEAFVRGWLAADVWGRLLVGAWLVSKMGGFAAMRAAGGRAAAAWLTGFGAATTTGTVAAGTAGGAAAGGAAVASLRSRFMSVAKRGGLVGAGLLVADQVAREFETAMKARSKSLFEDLSGLAAGGNIIGRGLKLLGDPDETTALATRTLEVLERIRDERGHISRAQAVEIAQGLQYLRLSREQEQVARRLLRLGVERGRTERATNAQIAATALLRPRLRNLRLADDMKDLSRSVGISMRQIEGFMDRHPQAGARAMRIHFRGAVTAMDRLLRGGKVGAGQYLSQIQRFATIHSKGSRENIARNFHGAEQAIRGAMRAGLVSTEQGMAAIRKLMLKSLRLYGFSAAEAAKLTRAGVSAKDIGNSRGISGPLGQGPQGLPGRQGNARGGLHQFGRAGQAGRDTIPAQIGEQKVMVGPGETAAVLTRHQRQGLDQRLAEEGGLAGYIRRVNTPHYMARGGLVEAARGWSGVSPSGLNPAAKSVALWAMRKYDASASSTLRAGDSDSWHSKGAAVDLTSGNMLAMARGIDAAYGRKLEELIHTPLGYSRDAGRKVAPYAQADHYDHVHIAALGKALAALTGMGGDIKKIGRVLLTGEPSPVMAAGQSALDSVRAGVNKRLGQIAVKFGGAGVGGDIPHFSGPWTEVMEKIARDRGWSLADWKALVQAESGGDPTAVNPTSGAFGLGQFLGATKDAYAKYGAASTNPVEQIHAMARYIADRYGTPTRAWAFHQANNWYESGGLVGGDGGSIADEFHRVLAAQGLDLDEGGVPRTTGRFPSRAQVVGQKRDTEAAALRLRRLRGKDTPEKEKARERLEKARKAARKDLGRNRARLKKLREGRRLGRRGQRRRRSKVSGYLEGLDLPEQLIGSFDTRSVSLEDAEALYSQAEDRYRAEERVTPDTLRALLGPNMGGLSAEEQQDLIGSAESILTPAELNDLVGRQQGLLAGYGGQDGHEGQLQIAAKAAGALGERVPKVEKLLARMRARVKANLKELRDKAREQRRVRRRLANNRRRLDVIGREVAEIRKKKRPTEADRKRRERLGKEADGIRRQVPRQVERLRQLGARIPVVEGDNQFLAGEKRPRGDLGEAGGLIGEAREMLDDRLRPELERFSEHLRPAGVKAQIEGSRLTIGALNLEGAWSPQRNDPAGSAGGADDGGRADLLAQLLDQSRQAFRVSQAQFGVLSGFRGEMPLPDVGAFVHGGRVRETGMALVHRDEFITPDPAGPYGTRAAPGGGGGAAPVVEVSIGGELGAFMQAIDGRITATVDGRSAPVVSRDLGRRSRYLASAPGNVRGRRGG